MATYLDRILEVHRGAAAADVRPLEELLRCALGQPPARGFRAALERSAADGSLAVIAEIKRRSPSKGALNTELDPVAMAARYEAGGAAALSVLTDEEFFGGSASDLVRARRAVDVPVLRKDFTVSVRDICDARIMGADAVLLIAAALQPGELRDLHGCAIEIGLDVLVEVHDEAELAVAESAGASLIGVNQRDLVTFKVDHERARRMAGVIPESAVRVAESGVRDAQDAIRLRDAGYHAVLVGESVVTAADPASAIRALTGGN